MTDRNAPKYAHKATCAPTSSVEENIAGLLCGAVFSVMNGLIARDYRIRLSHATAIDLPSLLMCQTID